MTCISTENSEALNDGPLDTPLTPDEVAHYRERGAANKRYLAAAIAARAAKAEEPTAHILATDKETVAFVPFGDIVKVTRKRSPEGWAKQPWRNVNPDRMSTMQVANARKLYAKLRREGYEAF